MKTIKQVYSDLNAFYASLDTLKKWMNSKKGHEFAKRLGREPLDQLIKRFQAPDIKKNDYIQKLNSYKYAVVANKLQRRAIIVKDYDKKVKEMKEEGLLKLPKSLTKEDRMKMETYLIHNECGDTVQKKDRKGRLFWNCVTNKPIPVRKRKSNEMGLAQKCHLYELHKMEKWDRKNPVPSQSGLSYDLFPKELLAAHNTRRELQVERVRDMLSERFYGAKIRKPLLHLFEIRRFRSDFIPGGFGVYETEVTDPNKGAYDFTFYKDEYPTHAMIMKKLQFRIMHNRKDSTLLGLKVYDQFGNVRGSISDIDALRIAA